MEKQELEIIIRQDGSVTIAVKGVRGSQCLAVTKGLEESVGCLTQRSLSAAFYEDEERENTLCRQRKNRIDLPR